MASFRERHGHPYGWVNGCVVCREESKLKKRRERAKKRGLEVVDTAPVRRAGSIPEIDHVDVVTEPEAGPCVSAVRRQVEDLGVADREPVLCAAAESMARILDNPNLATTQPSAVRQLMAITAELHRVATPKPGKLAVVQAMTSRGR